MLKQLSDKRSC